MINVGQSYATLSVNVLVSSAVFGLAEALVENWPKIQRGACNLLRSEMKSRATILGSRHPNEAAIQQQARRISQLSRVITTIGLCRHDVFTKEQGL